MKHLKIIIAVALPVLVLAGVILKSEYTLSISKSWVIEIGGYDPRDLIRGHYIRYRPEFDWEDEAQKFPPGLEWKERCLCLKAQGGGATPPKVSKTSCEQARATCDGFIRDKHVSRLRRFYVPEKQARPLEKLIRDKKAAVAVSISPDGAPIVTDLLIDNKPWREAVKAKEE